MADEVKLEEQWVREKAAKQEAARRPRKPPRMLLGVVIAVLLMAVVGVGIYVVVSRSPREKSAPLSDKVRIEVRSMPAMTIAKDGVEIGKTPLSFIVTRSTVAVTLTARWTEQRFYPTSGMRRVPREATKTVVPDRDQTIDFTRKDK